MNQTKIVVLTHVYDQVDLLKNFFDWYTQLGVDAFLVQDMGSTDGTLELLQELAQHYPMEWFSLEQKNLREHRFGNTGDEMALLAREKLDPKWLMMCDADEFLVLEHDSLSIALEKAEARGLTSIEIPCFNMTGRALPVGGDAVALLSLRIVSPYVETAEQQVSGVLPQPFIFIRHRHKSIVLASAFSGYNPGSHGALVRFGQTGQINGAWFNHYSIRGYDTFEQKIRNVEAFLSANDHLPSWWGWHWRRWVRLYRLGQLRADYDAQFVSEADEVKLIENGTCVLDRQVADWVHGMSLGRSIAPPDRQHVAATGGEVMFHDWFLSAGVFELPEWIDASSRLAFSPFLFWLVQALQPRLILDIGAADGYSWSTLCQALD